MTTAVSALEQELQEARRRVRQLEQRLAEQRTVTQSREDMLATVVAHAPVILWSIDQHGLFTLSEGRGLAALDLLSGEVVGKSIFELYGDHPEVLEHVRRALEGNAGSYLTQMGELWFESWLSPTCDSTGAITGVIGVATDVTAWLRAELAHRALGERMHQTAQELERLNADLESRIDERTALLMRANQMLQEQIYERRRAIELLEESQERWRSLVQNAPDMIIQLNGDRSIGFINHTGVRSRFTPQDLIGKNALALLPPGAVADVDRQLDRVFTHAESVSHEAAVPDGQGGTRWFQSHVAPIVRIGRVTGATVVCREVTEFKRAAEQLRQTQDRLIHVARVTSAGEMTAAIAHELNQPLAAIANYVRGCMIRLQADGTAAPEILETLQESVDEAHRASVVIRRLRQFLQRQELQREPGDLNEMVQDALRLAEPALRRHEAQPRLSLAPQLPLVFMDRVQMIQVVLNLLLNAAEAMAGDNLPEREVLIETRVSGDGRLELRISDRGPGLPADLGESIFDAFVTTKHGGLGMGLSISRTIIEAHRGTLRSETLESSRGARFVISLPSESLKVVS